MTELTEAVVARAQMSLFPGKGGPKVRSFSADRRSAIIVPAPRAVSPFAPAAENRPWQVDQAIFAVFSRVPWQRRAR